MSQINWTITKALKINPTMKLKTAFDLFPLQTHFAWSHHVCRSWLDPSFIHNLYRVMPMLKLGWYQVFSLQNPVCLPGPFACLDSSQNNSIMHGYYLFSQSCWFRQWQDWAPTGLNWFFLSYQKRGSLWTWILYCMSTLVHLNCTDDVSSLGGIRLTN